MNATAFASRRDAATATMEAVLAIFYPQDSRILPDLTLGMLTLRVLTVREPEG